MVRQHYLSPDVIELACNMFDLAQNKTKKVFFDHQQQHLPPSLPPSLHHQQQHLKVNALSEKQASETIRILFARN